MIRLSIFGGEDRIWTCGTVSSTLPFQGSSLGLSDTSPLRLAISYQGNYALRFPLVLFVYPPRAVLIGRIALPPTTLIPVTLASDIPVVYFTVHMSSWPQMNTEAPHAEPL